LTAITFAQKLNLPRPGRALSPTRQARPKSAPEAKSDNREKALRIWRRAKDPRSTPAEAYLRGRGLDLPREAAGEAIRFAPRLFFLGKTFDAMVCLVRNIVSNEPQGVHITEILEDGRGDRFTYGPTKGGAIKLDPDENVVTMGLHIGEGVESCLEWRQCDYAPVWSVINAGGIADFPVLPGIDALTILGENDDANIRAAETCRARWAEAKREVLVLEPLVGSDFNDVMRGRTTP
jgi:hypothetical protein